MRSRENIAALARSGYYGSEGSLLRAPKSDMQKEMSRMVSPSGKGGAMSNRFGAVKASECRPGSLLDCPKIVWTAIPIGFPTLKRNTHAGGILLTS